MFLFNGFHSMTRQASERQNYAAQRFSESDTTLWFLITHVQVLLDYFHFNMSRPTDQTQLRGMMAEPTSRRVAVFNSLFVNSRACDYSMRNTRLAYPTL